MEKESYLETIRGQRKIKEEGSEISANGPIGNKGEEIYKEAESIFSLLKEDTLDFQDKYISPLLSEYLKEIPIEKVEKTYNEGLKTYIKLQYRLYGGVKEKDTLNIFDDAYIRNIILSYTHDFIMSLRISKRLGVTQNTALDLAKLSYRYNPMILIRLGNLCPEVDDGVINRAAVGYPTDPEGFIEGVLARITQLKEIYPEVDDWVIRHASVHYPTDPKRFIDQNII